MNSERFEALIDAIVAIIITIIVLDLPIPEVVSWSSLFALRMNFFAYFVSFLLCYNFWNNHQKFFGYIEKIDHRVMWLGAWSMFVLSFIPYLTSLITNDFNALFPLFLYGLIFILIDLFFLKSCYILKNIDEDNVELTNRINIITKKITIIILIIVIGMVIGYVAYPPAVLYSCFGCLIASWAMSYLGIYWLFLR